MTDATLNDKAKSVADQADRDVKDASRGLSETADQVKKTVTEKAGVAKDWATDRSGAARDWALDQSDVLRDTVQTKPFISVGVSAGSAFAAGLIIGILLARS